MLILILFLVFGALVAYLAQHNLMKVVLNIGPYTYSDIPLFYIIVGSVLVGLGVSYIIYIINTIILKIRLSKKDRKILESTNEVADLTKRIHQLELENAKLKKDSDDNSDDENSL